MLFIVALFTTSFIVVTELMSSESRSDKKKNMASLAREQRMNSTLLYLQDQISVSYQITNFN